MDQKMYRRYLREYLKDALKKSDGTNAGITNYLMQQSEPGRFTRHREEKTRALADAVQVFREHRQWPVDMVFSFMGIQPEELR